MDITLEKIELVKDRTGCTYTEAKDALEKNDGSVVDAIIAIEDAQNSGFNAADEAGFGDSTVFAKMKEIVNKGNVTRILVTRGDKTIVNFPLTIGVLGTVLVPWGAIFGVVAAVGTQCEIAFVGADGKVIDINGKIVGIYDKAMDSFRKTTEEGIDVEKTLDKIEETGYRISDKLNELGDKGSAAVSDAWDKLEENGTIDDVKDAFEKGTSRLMDMWDKLEKSGKLDEVKDSVEKVAKKAADSAKGFAKEASEKYNASRSADTYAENAENAAAEEFKDEEL